MEAAAIAGAEVHDERNPGYGRCVHRCLTEALAAPDAGPIVLCQGDSTFRARDIDSLLAYVPHADVVNGTRTVERLRQPITQLTTFMYYGNVFVGKLLEAKHVGRCTITDVGTTYKLCHREPLGRLLAAVNPAINLEFNAHFLDTALQQGLVVVECPITFHPRVGISKGGNVSNRRALRGGASDDGRHHRRVGEARTVSEGYHASRFAQDPRRDVLWRTLWQHHFSSRIGAGDCVLDLGSGYGSFINQVTARRRIAVDAWPGFTAHLAPGVEAVVGDVTDLGFLAEVRRGFSPSPATCSSTCRNPISSACLMDCG